MTKHFNLPTSNYEIRCRIIGACAQFQDRLIFSKISGICQFDPVIILGNIGFLVSVGIVQGGMSKSLTQNGRSLASAININDLENIKECWNRIFSECARTKSITTHLAINQRIPKNFVIPRISLALGINPNPQNSARMYQLMDIFEKIGILQNDDDEYVFLNFEPQIVRFQIEESSQKQEVDWKSLNMGGSGRADFFDISP